MREQLPDDIQEELLRLRKKSRVAKWLFGGAVGVLVLAGTFLYLQNSNLLPGAFAKNSIYGQGINASGVASQYGSGSAASGGGGGCCGGGSGQTVSNKELEKEALKLYKQQFATGPSAASVKVTDFGCHIQFDIYDAQKKLLKSYAYRGGQLSLIA